MKKKVLRERRANKVADINVGELTEVVEAKPTKKRASKKKEG